MMVNYDIATVSEFTFVHDPKHKQEWKGYFCNSLTSLDKFPPLNYHKTLNLPTFCSPY